MKSDASIVCPFFTTTVRTCTLLCFLLCCALCAHAQQYSPTTTISGTVVGVNDKPMKLATILMVATKNYRDAPQVFTVQRDGHFSLTVPNGWYRMDFCGVDHKRLRLPNSVYCAGRPVTLDVKLEGRARPDRIDSITVITEREQYIFAKEHRMAEQPTGRYTYETPCNTPMLGYQVIVYVNGRKEQRSVNGTDAHHYEYDGDGDFRSFVAAKNGKAVIGYDPSQLLSQNDSSRFVFKDEFSQKVNQILDFILSTNAKHFQIAKQKGRVVDGDNAKPIPGANITNDDPAALRAKIRDEAHAEKDPLLKELRMMPYLSLSDDRSSWTQADATFCDEIFATVSPASVLWDRFCTNISSLGTGLDDETTSYTNRIYQENPSSYVKATLLFQRISHLHALNSLRKADSLYRILVNVYAGTYPAWMAQRMYNPARKIRSSLPIPPFSLPSVDSMSGRITPETLRGQWVLIDNWKTDCPPCVEEHPILSKVYQRFKDKHFTILSICYDSTSSALQHLREGAFNMPWLHTVAGDFRHSSTAKLLELECLQSRILISPNGTIVAVNDQLFGDQLEKTIANAIARQY